VTLGRPFQILALNGGGYRGLFSAALLAALEEDLDRPVINHFDLVTGTSTGGIIALALGAGLSPRSVIEFYEKHGENLRPLGASAASAPLPGEVPVGPIEGGPR
jgi:patatin-like phospholipase/acyl hydrolase